MEPSESAVQVSWIYSVEDESIARDLLRLAGVLERQGLVRNQTIDASLRARRDAGVPYFSPLAASGYHWRHARSLLDDGITVFLISPAALANTEWENLLQAALFERKTRIVLVLVRPVDMSDLPAQTRSMIALPKDGTPIATRRDSDDALLEVIQALQEIATSRRSAKPVVAKRERAEGVLSINDIFRLNGTPTVTFVEPPQFRELQLELGTMGTGLIVEGPSPSRPIGARLPRTRWRLRVATTRGSNQGDDTTSIHATCALAP